MKINIRDYRVEILKTAGGRKQASTMERQEVLVSKKRTEGSRICQYINLLTNPNWKKQDSNGPLKSSSNIKPRKRYYILKGSSGNLGSPLCNIPVSISKLSKPDINQSITLNYMNKVTKSLEGSLFIFLLENNMLIKIKLFN